jgi:hypothetical protein
VGAVVGDTVKNNDLVWDLESFRQRQRATDFVMGFENKLCVYSDSVEQLYTNYNIFFPQEENRKLVILPNPYAHHDIYHSIPAAAVRPTRLNIIPGEVVGRPGLHLTIPFSSGKSRYRAVPLQAGLQIIARQQTEARPLLPVLKKGDLRELDANTPCLHLHTIDLDKLGQMSALERSGIRRVIEKRLQDLR